jgi:SAM-dependent methyltransferase
VGFYSAVIFPRLCDLLMDRPLVAQYRQQLLATVGGDVLEVGFGTGLNLPHYPAQVHRITTVDPNPGMHRLAQRRVRTSNIEVAQRVLRGERLPFEADRFDCAGCGKSGGPPSRAETHSNRTWTSPPGGKCGMAGRGSATPAGGENSGAKGSGRNPEQPRPPAHDAFTRLLHRLQPDAETLWQEARMQVTLTDGVLVADDSTLDKPYAKAIALVGRHWSGKHHAVVQGINLVSLLWTDGDRHLPCDYRIYHDAKEATKNDHFRAMLQAARARGFQPRAVIFDGWYSRATLPTGRPATWP